MHRRAQRSLGGIPLDEIGAPGLGLPVAAEEVASEAKLGLDGSRVAVEGFGAVGQPAARFLAKRGVRLVAASDSQGGIHDPDGLDVDALIAHKRTGRALSGFTGGRPIGIVDLVAVSCDLDPGGPSGYAHCRQRPSPPGEADLQGANIPATEDAEQWMYSHGIVNVPDFIATREE